MLTRRIIPCLDTRDGRVVKGVRFVGLRDAGDPVELAARYADDGADEIVVLDVSATTEERAHALDTVRLIRDAVAVPLTVGGGIRTEADARALLDAGADKVGINTAAYRTPEIITALASRFGSQCVTLSVDARARTAGEIGSRQPSSSAVSWELVVRAGSEPTGFDAVQWARESADRGAGEILLTSVDRDGTQSGYDLDLLTAVSRAVRVPVVASGGARSAADLIDALGAGADAVLAASIFHDGLTTVQATKRALAAAGIPVRL